MAIDATGSSSTGAVSRAQIAGAIRQASGATGTSFQYLLATAKMESNFQPDAAAATSSARGLFQFINQTWLGTVKEAGTAFGYGQYSDAISKSASGSYAVSDPEMRSAIMKLRDDPVASSAMAGVLAQSNSFKLTGEIGRRPTDAELYMAHFMGVGGASKLINAAQDTPGAPGAAMFPNAAAANRSIFYDRSGNARSVSGVYAVLNDRYDSAANSQATRSAMANAGGAPATFAIAASPVAGGVYLSSFPDARGAAVGAVNPVPASSQSTPLFRSLFQAGSRAEPVSPVVQELWGKGALLSSAAGAQPTVRAPHPLDLFSDRSGTFSG